VLQGMPLEAASRAVDEGMVLNAATGEPVRWEGWPMVLPTTERLRERTGGAAYEAAVTAARAQLGLVLTPPEGAANPGA
jgi:hypothetical protein